MDASIVKKLEEIRHQLEARLDEAKGVDMAGYRLDRKSIYTPDKQHHAEMDPADGKLLDSAAKKFAAYYAEMADTLERLQDDARKTLAHLKDLREAWANERPWKLPRNLLTKDEAEALAEYGGWGENHDAWNL